MRRSGTTLAAGAAALALVWWWRGPVAPPLYDGVVAPPSAYRFLQPAAGQLGSPGTGVGTLRVQGGVSAAGTVFTGEQPPQAGLRLDAGALTVPAGATTVTVTVTPVAPSGALPGDGDVDGNVYRLQALATGGAASRDTRHRVLVDLESTGTMNVVAIEEAAGGRWVRLPTTPVGQQMYEAPVSTLGDVAVVGSGSTSGEGTPSVAAAVAGSVLALLLVVIGVVTLRRPRPPRRPPADG